MHFRKFLKKKFEEIQRYYSVFKGINSFIIEYLANKNMSPTFRIEKKFFFSILNVSILPAMRLYKNFNPLCRQKTSGNVL